MNIIDNLVKELNPLINDGLTLTAAGRSGHGNQFFRVHYMQNNLISKVSYRHDLSRLGLESPEVTQYIENLKSGMIDRWTALPGRSQVSLADTMAVIGVKDDTHLAQSLSIGKAILTNLNGLDRVNAFVRQWRAKDKGTGLEAVIIAKDEEDKLAVIELSVNFYLQSPTDRLANQLKLVMN